jgi:hypothetical protein
MRVLILTQYFLPETGATTNRIISLAKGLQRRGHDVVVVTAKLNHPEGIIRDGYREGCPARCTGRCSYAAHVGVCLS